LLCHIEICEVLPSYDLAPYLLHEGTSKAKVEPGLKRTIAGF
jgi:hypothetical protein